MRSTSSITGRRDDAAGQLRRLDLRDTSVSDEAIDTILALPQLEELNLPDAALTGKGLQRLGYLKSLRQLSICRLHVASETNSARTLSDQEQRGASVAARQLPECPAGRHTTLLREATRHFCRMRCGRSGICLLLLRSS